MTYVIDFGGTSLCRTESLIESEIPYVTENEDMANLFLAIQALRDRDWFPRSVRDIRAFRIEQWSDFTAVVKSEPPCNPVKSGL